MVTTPQVTICIPVYNGAEFVAQTLNSVARQTYPNVRVIISDDASSDGSTELCRVIAQKHGFELTVQPRRRGWIENCNVLLERARSNFVCIVAHDDVLDERYIAALAAHLAATPVCVQAFCDVQGFGSSREPDAELPCRIAVRATLPNDHAAFRWYAISRLGPP